MAVPEALAVQHVARRVVAALTEEERALCCLMMSFDEPGGPDKLLLEAAVMATRWKGGVPIEELKPTVHHMRRAGHAWGSFFVACLVFLEHGDEQWDRRVREIHCEMGRSDLPFDQQEQLERELEELIDVPVEKRGHPDLLTTEELCRLLKASAPTRYGAVAENR